MTPDKSKMAAKPTTDHPENFEHAFAELESIVAQMESGQMTLEASLAAYQRGNLLLQFCQQSLAEVEQQVQLLNERNQLVQFKSDNA
ncbi:MAG: exodeoxyribonuclease VII small subunit [Betaproteobacteria bacterium HGW-Betaproteobacteria-20]|nr:MAG: exodeoxyribonuclease VII small subunit [Betaproteobacteria bacterium HGW-Betaproteobacteria-20]